jgi:hypothetical protein
VYVWSGLAKLNGSWLSGEALASFRETGSIAGPLADALASSPRLLPGAAWLVALTELAIGPLLLARRTRRVAVVAALGFHAVLESVVHPDFFGFAMAILLLAFVGDTEGAEVTDREMPTSPSRPATR